MHSNCNKLVWRLFQITLFLRTKQGCSSYEVVSKECIFLITAIRLEAWQKALENMQTCTFWYQENLSLDESGAWPEGLIVFCGKDNIWVGVTEVCSNSPCSPFHFGMSLSDEEILKERMLQVHFWKFSAVNQNAWPSKITLSRQQHYGDILEHTAFCGPSGHILLKPPWTLNYNLTSCYVFCSFVLHCDFALCFRIQWC